MPRKVSPPRNQLHQLRQPLTEGEREVFDFLDQHLPDVWEIYLQPHLNGLRPDFVLLHPLTGIVVIEVKDWHLDAMEYRVEERGNGSPPQLLGRVGGGKEFVLEKENPFHRIQVYREEILDLYCPSFSSNPTNAPRVVAGLVVFTRATRESVLSLAEPFLKWYGLEANPTWENCRIAGLDDLDCGDINRLVPWASYRDRGGMSEDVAQDLRHWLEEPEFSAEQRRKLPLDPKQTALATTRTTSGYRRVKGPAGCGKSQVLAARASQIAFDNPAARILVVSFNITLLNYLMDLAVRWPRPGQVKSREHIDLLNFHHWCKRLCISVGARKQYSRFWKERFDEGSGTGQPGGAVFDTGISSLVDQILGWGGKSVAQYDAILVDEGQDFRPEWWNCLRKVLTPGGEMLLVADVTQDIYGRSGLWTDEAMTGCGFSGDWVKLAGSYRIPAILRPIIRDFSAAFLSAGKADPPGEQSDFLPEIEGPCTLVWRQVAMGDIAAAGLTEALKIAGIDEPEPVPFPDVTIVVSSRKLGCKIVKELETLKIESIHTFDLDHEHPDRRTERRKKLAFYKGDARVKVTTIHSFKGLETRALVICHAAEDKGTARAELLYTAMTRLKRTDRGSCLSVVTDDAELFAHGRTWPDFQDQTHLRAPSILPAVIQAEDDDENAVIF